MSNETYYYGQGKIYLAPRGADGKPGAWRWVGDVSALSVSMEVENFDHKESYSGQRAAVRRIITGKDATLTSTWHDHNADNLALLLYGESTKTDAGTVTGEALPAGIQAGERYTLAHQNISDVVIGSLVAGTDYAVDPEFGAITFLTAQATAPTVNYKHGASTSMSVFSRTPDEVAFRFEGLNLAENEQRVILELYKIKIDPATGLTLINNDTSLAGLETSAAVLSDTQRGTVDAQFGRFGRLIHVGAAV